MTEEEIGIIAKFLNISVAYSPDGKHIYQLWENGTEKNDSKKAGMINGTISGENCRTFSRLFKDWDNL